ncbi:LOW QUALITY PROTEIN: hypothetical protein Cgig2_026381 [Carnegiea gigantea]|uniref:Uncharacterized protein n=1 Tax=Carnegiea gigantea TaxID=171969 RepID=A0A9Q1Q722_9CARY|nr:LOW QUALITY PROTEIN: hypothetical protein Cgig2_026381 [Carnegiea gigantea]
MKRDSVDQGEQQVGAEYNRQLSYHHHRISALIGEESMELQETDYMERMDNVIVWNIRGLNNHNKQEDVMLSLQKNKVGMVCLVETKIKPHNLEAVRSRMFTGWCMELNFQLSSQKSFFMSFVYGFNNNEQRRQLWESINTISFQIQEACNVMKCYPLTRRQD